LKPQLDTDTETTVGISFSIKNFDTKI